MQCRDLAEIVYQLLVLSHSTMILVLHSKAYAQQSTESKLNPEIIDQGYVSEVLRIKLNMRVFLRELFLFQ